MTDHLPIRGNWICVGCSLSWPCPTRRRQLLAQYTDAPVSLTLVLGSALVDACADLADIPAGDLHARFVGWARPLERQA
jgi:hypothetical protein